MNGTIYPATTGQLCIGCVHNGIDLLLRDITLHQLESAFSDSNQH
jgi:hypothetical protein